MSVDTRAYIGFGWIIDQNQKNQMEEAAGDLWDEFESCFSYITIYLWFNVIYYSSKCNIICWFKIFKH